ncbi:hypothetical protein B0T20DRAFT_413452 [Sordaria brevicollis]|uniref:Uncharacterized protein n=1 Tax=Sordaria brevicollis TaxID=83679 RepID=A0AAE0PE55_SORBR|nr:hypothetical protein B0T20DRAFT_413452 [Sordaria brevicollis]
MERPAKRSRTGPAPFDDDEVVGDELNHQPEEVNQLRDPGYQLEKARSYAAFKLKSAFENIFEKYGRDFDGIGDEIDLRTGQIVVDNGHIKSLKAAPLGVENDDDEDDESESESGHEEKTISPGQGNKQNATSLQTIPRPLPSIVPPSPYGGFGPNYNSFPGGPQPLPNMMYQGQAQFQSFPMPFGAFSSTSSSVDPAWRAPDLPQPVPWGGFWTPGTQSRFKTVAKVQKLIGGTSHAEEGEDEDDILLDEATTETTKAPENTPVTIKKLAAFRPPSNVSSPANRRLKTSAATSTPNSKDRPGPGKANGEKKNTPKRKTPAKKTPPKSKLGEEQTTSLMEQSGVQNPGSPVVEAPPASIRHVAEAQPVIEQTAVVGKPLAEGQFSGEVNEQRTPKSNTTETSKPLLTESADLARQNHVNSAPVPTAEEQAMQGAFESHTQPILEREPSAEDQAGQSFVKESRVEAIVFKGPGVGADKKMPKRRSSMRRASMRERLDQEANTNMTESDSSQSLLIPENEQSSARAQLVVEIQSSLTGRGISEKLSVQETTVEEPAAEKISIYEGPVAETEAPSMEDDQNQSTSVSSGVTKTANLELPEKQNSTDSRAARRERRLSKREQPSPAAAMRTLSEDLVWGYQRSLFDGETNANTTFKYYCPSRSIHVAKPSNQQLWVDIPANSVLAPQNFEVVVDDDTPMSDISPPDLASEHVNTIGAEGIANDGIANAQVPNVPEPQTDVEERSPPPTEPPYEVFTRNVVDSAYAFSDEDEPAIPKPKVRRVGPIKRNSKPKVSEKPTMKESGIPTPASSFDHMSQTAVSQTASQTEIPMEELPAISETVAIEPTHPTPSVSSALFDKTNTNSEELPPVPESVRAPKSKRGRKPKTPIDLPVKTGTLTVTGDLSEPFPIITILESTRPRRQSLRLSRGRRDSDVTIAESTTPQHAKATATVFQHEDEPIVIQESPQGTPEPEAVDDHESGRPASPTLSVNIPASPKSIDASPLDEELPEDNLLEEAIARQRFWSPKPESIILGDEPSPAEPQPRADTILEVLIPSKRLSLISTSPLPQEEEHPDVTEDVPPQEQEHQDATEDVQPQEQPEQPTTPLKTKPRRGRPSSAASIPTATITTTTKVKTKTGSGSGPGRRRKAQTPSTATRISTTSTATSLKNRTLMLKQQPSQTPAQKTPGTTRSLLGSTNKSILSLISSDTDDEDELTLDLGTPSGPSSMAKRKRVRPPTASSAAKAKSTTAKKTTSSASLLSASLLRTPSRKPQRRTTSLAKIASAISVGRETTPTGGLGEEEAEEEEDFVGSEVIQTPGGTLRRCGEAGFRCDRDFCFGCL